MKNDDMKQQLVQMGNGAHALATQILGNADDAADAVHDAFAKVLRRPEAYDASNGPLKPWFFRIVRNRCIDLIRRRRPADDTVDELIDATPGPEGLAEISQRDEALQQALSELPSGQREIIVLRDYLDLSYVEIADIQEIAQGTVMSRLHRARMALKKELTRDE
ncbi:MAG: RNA polymerase sigma factor [Xanthomonadales bacterium]|nr:RNA polymerase sigma factor [Xanthomonadales bacterium]